MQRQIRKSLTHGGVAVVMVFLSAGTFLCGCSTLPGTPEPDVLLRISEVTFEEDVHWYHSVLFWSKPLPRAILVRKMEAIPLDTGNLQCLVEVRNNTSSEIRIDYQVTFYDKKGVRVEEAPWRMLILPKAVEKQILCNSVAAEAERFRMHIRRAR